MTFRWLVTLSYKSKVKEKNPSLRTQLTFKHTNGVQMDMQCKENPRYCSVSTLRADKHVAVKKDLETGYDGQQLLVSESFQCFLHEQRYNFCFFLIQCKKSTKQMAKKTARIKNKHLHTPLNCFLQQQSH